MQQAIKDKRKVYKKWQRTKEKDREVFKEMI